MLSSLLFALTSPILAQVHGLPRTQVRAKASAVKALTMAATPVLEAFDLKTGGLEDLTLPQTNPSGFLVKVTLGTKRAILILREHDVRAANFVLRVTDDKGTHTVPRPKNVTYRGIVADFPHSTVAASLIKGQLTAIVRLDHGQTFWGIQPLSEVDKSAERSTHVVYDSADNKLLKSKCGLVHGKPGQPEASRPRLAKSTWTCDIAIDADYPFYKKNSSNVAKTQADVTTVINACAVIYKADCDIDYKITTILVRTKALYTSPAHSTLLSQFRTEWNTNQTKVTRDVAHLFTGTNLTGSVIGVAWLSVICSSTSGYGLSQSRYSSNITNRTGLTAHELGHNWSSPHCNSQKTCNIMCPTLGGCSRNLKSFTAWEQTYIEGHRDSRNCLDVKTVTGPKPILASISPTVVQSQWGGSLTLKGTRLLGAHRVNVGGQVVYANSFKSHTDTQVVFDSPKMIFSSAPAAVTAQNSEGLSNALLLKFTDTSPPKLVAPATVGPGSVLLWEFGGKPKDKWFITLAATGTTTVQFGFNWLLNPILFGRGLLNQAGYGYHYVIVPGNVAKGIKVYAQVVTISGTGTYDGNSNVVPTTVK